MKRPARRSIAVATLATLALLVAPSISRAEEPPTTGFEDNGGANWTTHDEEVAFLQEVADSPRVALSEIGRTLEGRPLHLVELGFPGPDAIEEARQRPTVLFICTQHGNEPAGREACLEWLRDLAFTEDPDLVRQLQEHTILFVPTANPDGRAANTRGNSEGDDINRDHLNLETLEAQAIATVVRDWQPDVVVDLHEFGSTTLVYDDEILYLWTRNLNADIQVRREARTLAEDYIKPGAEANGQRAGEYGRYRVPVTDYHITQVAGDEDEGIARNLFGLRHSAGLLLETRVGADPRTSIDEVMASAANQNRRVDTHYQAVADTLLYMRDLGPNAMFASSNAAERKALEGAEGSAPVYFNGQDEDLTLLQDGGAEPTSIADPPPCGYELTADQWAEMTLTFLLHGIAATPLDGGGAFVSMAQPAEPVIPLLLDDRGNRNAVSATPLETC
jgi:hypothetical protein